jgi:hypothetical protein
MDLIKAKLHKEAVWDSKIQQVIELVNDTVSQNYLESDNTYWQ